MAGRSLLPFFARPGMSLERDVLIERGPGEDPYAAVRTGRYLYVEYASGVRELYDLRRDPHELRSRHASPAYAGVRRKLARRLDHLRDCRGVECRTEPS
jgi:hypothetical protein